MMLGVPAGVKMHSSVFALSPEAAGEIMAAFARGETGSSLREVMDIDETDYRNGSLTARLYGYAPVPSLAGMVQHSKCSDVKDDEMKGYYYLSEARKAKGEGDDDLYKKQLGLASAALKKATKAQKNNPFVAVKYAEVLEEQGKKEMALQVLYPMLEGKGTPAQGADVRVWLGDLFLEVKDEEDAEEGATDAPARARLRTASMSSGQIASACRHAPRARSSRPRLAQAWPRASSRSARRLSRASERCSASGSYGSSATSRGSSSSAASAASCSGRERSWYRKRRTAAR